MTREKIQAGYYSKGWARIWVIRFDSDILKVLLRYGPHRKRPYLKYGPDYIGTVYISVDKWDAIRNNTIRQFEEISKIQEEYISHVEIPQELREIVEKYYRENVKICKLC